MLEDNGFRVFDYKNSQNTILTDLHKNGAFKGFDKQNCLNEFTFCEFTLEELKLPSPSYMLDGVKKIEKEVGLQGWMVRGIEKKKGYNGFSLTYNPDYFDKEVSPYHQTWGHKLMTQTYSAWDNLGKHKQTKNTYYDTYAFRQIHNIIYENLKDVFDRLNMPLLRSRCAYLWPEPDVDAFQNNWHIDEYPYEMLRLNIPLQTSPEHELHIKGKDFLGNSFNLTKHLEVGKVYLWNTNIPHTIGYKKEAPLDLPRIHLVLGLATYFDYNKEQDCFVKSQHWGKKLIDIVKSKGFVKNE